MDARRFGANVDPLSNLLARTLPELPRKIMSPPMELQILVSLKPLVADFAHESVRREEGRRGQRNYL